MNISTGQSYIVGVVILALRVRWLNSQYVKPLYNARDCIGIALSSWILLVPIGIYLSWEWFRDGIEHNGEDKYNKVVDKYYIVAIKYNGIADDYIKCKSELSKSKELLREVSNIDFSMPMGAEDDKSCIFCGRALKYEEHTKDCTYMKTQEFIK